MHFKYLNLQKARKEHLSTLKNSKQTPGRRRFMKSMGLGVLAWNPLIRSVQDNRNESFHFKNNKLTVYAAGKVVWEISEKYFEPGYQLQYLKNESKIQINGQGLQPKRTALQFSLKIDLDISSNELLIQIPEYNFRQTVDFKNWIEEIETLKGNAFLNTYFFSDNSGDFIRANGNCKLSLSPVWVFSFYTKHNFILQLTGKKYITSQLSIHPNSDALAYQKSQNSLSTEMLLTDFEDAEKLVDGITIEGGSFTKKGSDNGSLSIRLNYKNPNEKTYIFQNKKSDISYSANKVASSEISFESFFYFAEYLNNNFSRNFISACLPEQGVWINNSLGSFKIERDEKLPDFEAFGTNHIFDEVFLEPRLKAFKPNLKGATVLNTIFRDPQKVSIQQKQKKSTSTQSVQKNTSVRKQVLDSKSTGSGTSRDPQREQKTNTTFQQKETGRESSSPPNRRLDFKLSLPQKKQVPPGRKVSKGQPNISADFDKVKFKPKKALSIWVLRPEDLVLLEFTFHNFSFTNKGQSPYLELDNKKKKGIVVVNFQTQHTLEEAFYESTPIPDPEGGSSETVKLPAKHLRAGKSRLVYELPAFHDGFPLIMSELLDWSKFKLRVHPRAWIKVPLIKEIKQPKRLAFDKKSAVIPNKNLKYLNTPSTEYGIKLAQNNKVRASNLEVYKESEVTKVLSVASANSVKSTFNTHSIKKISWKVEAIPQLSTAIEAPALLFISPNQTNDFYHKTRLELRDTEEIEFKITDKLQLNTKLRALDPLSTNKGEVAELWHTRLGVKLKNGKTSGTALPHFKTIRALWAFDADSNYKTPKERNYPFMASLDANNRQKLVHTTSNYSAGFEPFPVPVNNLMLTTLGAYLDWHAFFDVPTPQDNYLNIIEWEHIATLGRDHFVKIVEEGYLFPFGHRAAVVKITERKFHQKTKSAVNRQRMFIVVLEKEVLYSRNDPDDDFIEFPFQAVRLETNSTPNIDNPENTTLINVPSGSFGLKRALKKKSGSGGGNTMYNFYINVAGNGFPFDIIATDKEGQEHAYRMPLAFMENRIARDAKLMEDVIEVYRGNQSNGFNALYNESDFNGKEVAYAEYLVEGDTAFETEIVKFDAQVYPAKGEGDLKFHPKMKEAKVFIKEIDEMTGVRELATIGLEDDKNDGGIFARLLSNIKVDFSGGTDKAGGFLTPNIGVSGLSKLQGPISGKLDDMKSLQFIPEDFFGGFDDLPIAKIFGVIDIFSLLFGESGAPLDLGGSMNGMKNAIAGIRDEIDSIKNEILYLENLVEEGQQAVQQQINDLQQMIKDKVTELLDTLNNSVPKIPNLKTYVTEEAFYAEYKWQPELQGNEIEVIPSLLQVNVKNPTTALSITTKVEKPFDADKPATINGLARFEKFGIDIIPLLAVNFNYLEFKTGSSEKTDVKVDIDPDNPIQFKGVLNFVNNLQSIIPSNGFSDSGPYIKLQASGVTAGFDIAVPNVEVGILMISNISLGAFIKLPFTGAPLLMGFNFCKRENPFLLTVSCFGGGGYFMMTSTLKGLQSVEAAFEFGAAMSLNVGVASGGVSAMGGFYFKLEIVGEDKVATLTGYLRLNGHLSILGLISLSLEFYLAFSAVIVGDKVQKLIGEATLKVKVEVLFFSKTVSVSVKRELKGADADPKFVEMIDQDDWQEYCLAFAS